MTAASRGALARTLAATRRDLRLQWRRGLWIVYAVVCLAYVLVLQLFEPPLRELLATLVVFSDPSVLGFFFIGGLMLLERSEGTLHTAFASPLRVREWVAAKLISLTVLALVAGFAIALAMGTGLRPLLLVAAIVPTSTCFVLVGIIAGTRFATVNRYLLGGGLLSLPLLVPLLAPLGVIDLPGFELLPAGASLELLEAGLGGQQPGPWSTMRALAVLGLWNLLLWRWACAWMHRYVVTGET